MLSQVHDYSSLGLYGLNDVVHADNGMEVHAWLHALLTGFAVWTLDGPGLVTKSKHGLMDIKRFYGLYLGLTEESPSPCLCDHDGGEDDGSQIGSLFFSAKTLGMRPPLKPFIEDVDDYD